MKSEEEGRSVQGEVVLSGDDTTSAWEKIRLFAPFVITLAYPFLLRGWSSFVGKGLRQAGVVGVAEGLLFLLPAILVPAVGLMWAYSVRSAFHAHDIRVRVRVLAYLTMLAPPLFVFVGVARGLLGRPLSDVSVWLSLWAIVFGYVVGRRPRAQAVGSSAARPRLRVAHGVSAALIALFVVFHLTNHLAGLAGPDVHALVMRAGRSVYRLRLVEGALICLLIFQTCSGVALARTWSRRPADGFRILQVGSGIYLAGFITAHLNSALVGARLVRHVATDWAWASGGADGLLYDTWNIRLVPHYAWGVFFVTTHLALGVRHVMIGHEVNARLVNVVWRSGVAVSAVLTAAIMAALLGLRV